MMAGIVAAGLPVPPTDPYFSSVVLLAHMDGADASTVFTDSSPLANAIAAVNTAALSTTNPKFGTACCLLNGSTSRLSVSDSPAFDFGSGDFTIEGWARPEGTPSVAYGLMNKRASSAVYSPFNAEITTSRRMRAQVSTTGSSWVTINSSVVLALNTYAHWAITRSGSTLRLFVDGVLDGAVSVSGALMTNSAALSIGATAANGDYGWLGRLDETRITKGVARYTESFTPPTAPFPNS